MLPHTHDRAGVVELPIEGMTGPTEETNGVSYAGMLCATAMGPQAMLLMKAATGCVDERVPQATVTCVVGGLATFEPQCD